MKSMFLHGISGRFGLTLMTAGALMLAGCASTGGAKKADEPAKTVETTASAAKAAPKPAAMAKIEARSGSQVSGTLEFFATPDGAARVVVNIAGLTPGPHGIHLHEKGDCSDPEGKSAGGHWNPNGVNHGGPMDAVHHAGDFGNLEAGPDGRATMTFESRDFALSGDKTVVGRAVIIHEKIDDFVSQPTGNAGGRVGCGVIVGE